MTWYHCCDLCWTYLAPREYRELGIKHSTFYQCSQCPSHASYDICSACFDKGAWCKDRAHLLSRAYLSYRDKRVYWEDGVSQQTAKPLVRILMEGREKGLERGSTDQTTHSFQYKRRFAHTLHSSQSVIHPTLPLLIYPLDGRDLLFGDLHGETYFIYKIPFDWSETAETSGNTCIPIGVSLQFSSCGKYVHIMRFTVRNDLIIPGPIPIKVLLLTIALSSKYPCAAKPRLLPVRHSIELGKWPRLCHKLPYTLTWTDSYVYVSMSGTFLRVFRFPLQTKTWGEDVEMKPCEILMFSEEIALPLSARSRGVRFFPAKGNASAKLVLGSLSGDSPQPPIVVYLKVDHTNVWIPAKPEKIEALPYSLRTPDVSSLEEPYINDDRDFVADANSADGILTLEPVVPYQAQIKRLFHTRGVYCPSCFDLGWKLSILPSFTDFPSYDLTGRRTRDSKFMISWKVKASALIGALQSGCQFCCYISTRLLDLLHIRQHNQSFGDGVRCCAQGSVTKDAHSVKRVIKTIKKMQWEKEEETGILDFACEPLFQNIETQSFNKVIISIPGIKVGNEDSKFQPTVIKLFATNDSGETTTATQFIHMNSSRGTPKCVLEIYALPGKSCFLYFRKWCFLGI